MAKQRKSDKAIEQARLRHEKTLKRVALLERKIPASKKITRHPTFKTWIPTIAAIIEVGGSLLFVLVVVPILIKLLPTLDIDVPTPNINMPTPSLPTIPLPSINLPSIPKWLTDILYWVMKTLPIWLAVSFAIYESRKHRKK